MYNQSTNFSAVVMSPPRTPFEKYTAVTPPTIEAAQLGRSNIADVAYYMVCHGKSAVLVDPDSNAITYDSVRFDLGDWIVAYKTYELNSTVWFMNFRHTTEDERRDFGLTEFTV